MGAATLTISLYSLPPLLAAAAIVLLAVLVVIRERFAPVSICFAGIAAAVGLWLGSMAIVYSAHDPATANLWVRIAFLGIVSIAPMAYLFTLQFLRINAQYKLTIWLVWVVAAFFAAAALLSDALISGVYSYWWGYYTRFEWLSVLFAIYFGVLLGDIVRHHLLAYRAAPPGRVKRRIGRLALAFLVGYLAAVDILPAYGIGLYPIGYLPILGFVTIAAFAVRTYRLGALTPAFAAEEIVDTMSGALLLMTPDRVIRVANEAATRLFGRERTELIGRLIDELIPDPNIVSQIAALITRDNVRDYELSYRGAGGQQHTLSVAASVIRDMAGEPMAIVCGAQDITEYKHAIAQAEQQTEYLSALHETGLHLMERLDLSELLEAIISRAALLVGTTHGYIYVAAPGSDELVVTAGVGLFRAALGYRLKRGQGLGGRVYESGEPMAIDDYMAWMERAGGLDQFGFHAVAGVPLTSGSRVVGVLGLAYTEPGRVFGPYEVDVLTRFAQLASIALDNARLYSAAQDELAERRRAEEEVRRLNESLELRVSERTAELETVNHDLQSEIGERRRAEEERARLLVLEQSARAEAEEAVRAREAMLSVVSHDLRNPLSAIKGSVSLLKRLGERAKRADDAQLKSGLTRIESASNKMVLLIDELLDFARIQAGQALELSHKTTDLVALTNGVVDGLRHYARTYTLEVDSTAPTLIGRWDTMRIERVLDNLLSNAIKYSPEGSTIHVELSSEQRDGPWALLVVRDRGIGIPQSDLPHVFEWFHRASNVTGRIRGTGIGLASSRQVIEQHGGTITVASEEGSGTAFTVCLPLLQTSDE